MMQSAEIRATVHKANWAGEKYFEVMRGDGFLSFAPLEVSRRSPGAHALQSCGVGTRTGHDIQQRYRFSDLNGHLRNSPHAIAMGKKLLWKKIFHLMLTDAAVVVIMDQPDKFAFEAGCSVPEAFDPLVV
jgi:hypothetical protein